MPCIKFKLRHYLEDKPVDLGRVAALYAQWSRIIAELHDPATTEARLSEISTPDREDEDDTILHRLIRTPSTTITEVRFKLAVLDSLCENSTWLDARDRHLILSIRSDLEGCKDCRLD